MARRYRNSRYSYGGFPEYVSVSQRRENAKKQIKKLLKKGKKVEPIEIEGRTIARSFWGKGWCEHLEDFGDYSNRLPRGRAYVRNGSVCHLNISKGKVEAMVAGSELYHINVDIKSLPKPKWTAIKKQCTGKIGTLIELLQGKLSDEIMSTVTDADNGLFPQSGEISYRCDCPDYADMCKHVSAVMYGIGARLDSQPELLFLLRGVDHNELITESIVGEEITGKGSRRSRRRTISDENLENVFGVELDQSDIPSSAKRSKRKTTKRSTTVKGGRKVKPKDIAKLKPFKPTARTIANLRNKLDMDVADFAQAVGVTPSTISKWEKTKGQVSLHARSLNGLTQLYNKTNHNIK
jgi:uncharacterized Zn finger protein